MRDGSPKPVKQATIVLGEWEALIPGILNDAGNFSNDQILQNLKKAASIMQRNSGIDHWLSDEGQADLLRMIHADSKSPRPTIADGNSGMNARGSVFERSGSQSLSPLDYTEASKAMLMKGSLSAVGDNDGWVEIELTADSGACDTVIPRTTADTIPIMPSLASLRGMEYEVANGESIPNLGERRCLVWTEGATEAKKMNMQVADVHKGLLSLSRCADMGFEGRFGRRAGALICEKTGEVIPLIRKGNLYVLRVWVKAAPFGRQEP